VVNKWQTLPIELEYDTFGDASHPPVVLIAGYGAQMISWREGFVEMLADRGFFVVRFDNRDVGLSTKLDGVTVDIDAVTKAALFDEPVPPVPYTLSDMAADTVGLMDHLGIGNAHIFGDSLGGMIAQVFAIEHPTRTRSLISMNSIPGEPEVMQSTPEAMVAILSVGPPDRAGFIEHSLVYQAYHSQKYRSDAISRAKAALDFDRSYYPEGSPRQLAAIYASGRRTEALSALNVPTLVIHGKQDTLMSPGAGIRTAEIIPGAQLELIDDMGHDMPEPLWGLLVDIITRFLTSN
jgi:pimeloyl-ACP methyl ester carboxylesterase